MGLALVLNRHMRFSSPIRAAVMMPWIVPTALSSLGWFMIFDPVFSPISWLFKNLGLISKNINFLGDPGLAIASVCWANIWRGVPFFGITILAGLQAVPQELHEAAAIDGASVWHRFRHVTIPSIKGVVLIASLLSIIWTFADFQLIYILTKGGPANQTHIFGTYTYQIGSVGDGNRDGLGHFPLHVPGPRLLRHSASHLFAEGTIIMVGSNVFRAKFFSLFLPLTVYLLFLLFPFYWMLIVSFKPTNDLFEMKFNPFWIQQFTLENYLYLFQNTDFPSWLKNTLIVSVVSTALSLICSVFIGYALARLRFPGSNFLGVGIFLAYLVPPTLLFLPLAQVISSFGLNNTYWALILTYPTQLIPFASWLLMGYFRTIPKEIEESAMADGCSRIQILIRMVLPLSVPGLLSAGIFCFTLCWNEFLYALIFMSSGSMKTIPVGTVSDLIKADTLFWGALMASAVLGSFPIAFIYSFFVKHYVSGLTAGAVKGLMFPSFFLNESGNWGWRKKQDRKNEKTKKCFAQSFESGKAFFGSACARHLARLRGSHRANRGH